MHSFRIFIRCDHQIIYEITQFPKERMNQHSPNHAVATDAIEVPTVNTTLCLSNVSFKPEFTGDRFF